MLKTAMQRIVEIVCRRAHEQGFVSPQEVRAVLASAGLPEDQWLEVVSLAGDMLSNHDGRIYYRGPTAGHGEPHHRRLGRAVRQLMRGYQSSGLDERRRQGRLDFVQPVRVDTEEGRTFTLLSCDVSTSGIRLVAPLSLLGKKLRVTLPDTDGARERCFYARVVWSSLVGDGLYENGAAFLDIAAAADTEAAPARPESRPPIHFGGPMPPSLPQGLMPVPFCGGGYPRPR